MLQWLLSVVAVYEQMNGRWLIVAIVVISCCIVWADEWADEREVAGCCSGCCQLLQCISRMSGRWLVVAVVVDGCCSVLPR